MSSPSPFRLAGLSFAVLAASLCTGTACAQDVRSSLPVNAPTGTAGSTVGGAVRGPHKADVDYHGGQLHVAANNSSLNQILRDIGRLTGMKITGGVQDDRVFGSYGPAPATEVLAKLLDGTSSNLLIVENDDNGPAELILTPRHGGASPPNPNAAFAQEEDQPAPQQVNQQSSQGFFLNGQPQNGGAQPGGLPASNGGQTGTPIGGGANLGSTPGAFAGFGQTPQDATAQAPAANSGETSEQQSPNGASTPQQIYEQLQKLRQQQQSNPNSTSAPQ